jgi:hypothetical protein
MVAPGQENILEEYIQEQQQGDPELLAGKFRNQDELLKGYEELQRKLGQQDAPAEQQQSSEGYTQEQAVEVYGKEAVDSLQAKGINLADVMFKADSGEDISNTYDDLAAAFNVPRQVVENYVSKAQAGGSEDAGPAELSSQDEADIKEIVGGDQGFTELSEWAQANLDESELDAYNAAVDSNNKMAISWALKAMMARRAAPGAVIEPKLYGGGDAPQTTRFESQQQVLDAMNKRNERGQRLYDVDSAYRKNIEKLLAVSDVF